MNTKQRAEMYERIAQHGRNLQAIFPATAGMDPVELCKRLRRHEAKGARIALGLCNGDMTQEEAEIASDYLLIKVRLLLGLSAPVFHNLDPRGYALKISDEYVRDNKLQIYTDWGGFGIIAPDLTEG